LPFNVKRYMIRSFRCLQTEGIFNLRRSRRLAGDMQQTALRKQRMLNRAVSLDDLRIPPANRLEKLAGSRSGQWSIRINDQWRICFRWNNGDAFDVEIVDYH
jgi:toxin HigB-1